MTEDNKKNVLILGGCGFIGRHLVAEFLDDEIVGKICVVDKVPPQIAWMSPSHLKMFQHSKVTFKSANLMNSSSCEAVFNSDDWHWVINAAGETKPSQEEAVYKEGILKMSSNCSLAASKKGVDVYLEISSGQMSSSEKISHKEDDVCDPWSSIAKYKYEAEKVIQQTTGLNWIIIRPGLVYGSWDKQGLTSRLIIGAVYRHLGETMKLLWDEKLKVNTVHVFDLARSVVWLCKKGETKQIYNVVDDNNTSQGDIASLIAHIFNINHDYLGNILSNIAKTDMAGLIADINEKHLSPWAKICSFGGLDNTPLTPYLDQQAIQHAHLHLDGSKLKNTGFAYSVPKPTEDNLLKIIQDFISIKLFPIDAIPN